MIKSLRTFVILAFVFFSNAICKAYNDPYGFCSEIIAFEKDLNNAYDLSQYMQSQIHKIADKFISDCIKDEPGEISAIILRNVAIGRMKDLAEKFHFSRRIDLLSNFQNAQWVDLGYPQEIGSVGNYQLRVDLGFNNRFDCIVIHEVTNGLAMAHDPLRVIDGTQYILQEYSFFDQFSRVGEGKRYFVSKDGQILFVERLYDEDYLFNSTQFDNVSPLYSILIKTIKELNGID